ncbi:MAG: outer membrane beta-barrel protein [Bacillota bacterium]
MDNKIIIVTVCLLISIIAGQVKAENPGQVEFDSGISYNNFVYQMYRKGTKDDDYMMREDLHQGLGFYGEVIYWINNSYGLSLGIDKVEASWQGTDNYSGGDKRDFEYTSQLFGAYIKVMYELNDRINLTNSLINYQYEEHFRADYSWDKETFNYDLVNGSGLGFNLAIESNYEINEYFIIQSSAGYRYVKIDIEEEYDYSKEKLVTNVDDEVLRISGLGLKVGLNYKF